MLEIIELKLWHLLMISILWLFLEEKFLVALSFKVFLLFGFSMADFPLLANIVS